MNREEFLNRINKEGFSFAIDMTRCGFSDCKSLVRSRRLSGGTALPDVCGIL